MPVDEEEVVKELEAMPQEDPPADLRPAVMAAIQGAGRPASKAAPFIRRPRRWVFAAGWAVAATVIATFLFLVQSPSDSDLAATMGPVPIEYPSDVVTVAIWREGDLVKVQPKLTGPDPVTITVRWSRQSAAFAGIYGAPDASSQNNQTTFTLHQPSQRSVVSIGVHPAARTTEIVVLADDVEAVRAEVPLN